MIPSPKSFKLRLRRLGLAALAAFIPCGANAATIYGETADTDVRSDGNLSPVDGNSMLPGASGADPVMDRSAVYVFKLPDLGMVADPFTTATFRFNLTGTTNTPPNVDLYGLGRRTAATVLAGDYYGETTTVDPTNATFLQNNILISGTPVGLVSSNTSGGTALKNYLNTQYASGAGAGKYVFLRLSTDGASTAVRRYSVTAADGAMSGPPDTRPQIIYNVPTGYDRPFIWVRDSEKAGILDKIANHAWATSVYNGMVSRVAADLASHQSDRDAFLRQLPVDWSLAPAKFKTVPAYSESSVRYPAEAKFNDGLDCAVLYYLTGNVNYARCAADILHNAVKTLLPVAPSTSVGNGGWIFQSDFLKEARVTGTQLPIIYDFLYSYLQSNQVYDVQTTGMVDFNFTSAQSVFRTLYQLARDHGQKDSNWSALMSTCMLNSLLALDDAAERAAALQVYLVTGSSRQASLDYEYRVYTQPGDIWPESLQYAGAVGSIRTSHMVLLERVDPGLSLFDTYPNLPLSLPRISYLRYPNGEQVSFGDGHREAGGQPFSQYELVYQHALARGRTDLTSFFGSLINGGVASNQYNRSSLQDYATLGQHNEPLQLLWQTPEIAEPGVSPELPRTDTLPFAGIALQRNPAPVNNPTYGLMCFVGGAAHVHSHASGMSMELFGMGQVMGAKSGSDEYGSTLHENYYRLFASNNTVIVNGASRGQGGWSDIAINTVQTVAMEPQPFAAAVSADLSFTCSSFADDKGTLAEGTQQRTMAIVRTSPTSGFYVDVFRSKSSVTNRTATTLNGPVTDQYHDYIYRNIGETTVGLTADGAALPLVSQSTRFQNDIGDAYDQPGWRYFTNTRVSYPNSQAVRARFVATVSGTARYMDMHMPAVASREYARVDSPAIVDAPSPYNTRVAPALVVRQIGEAWNKPFAAVYEPHYGASGGTVQNVTQLLRSGVVVGIKIESTVAGKNLVHYIISNPGAAETFSDPAIGLAFTGRFGVATDNGDGTTTLYLGAGSSISYRGNSVATVSGASSQAEVRFAPGQAPIVTANAPVNVVAAPPPFVTWVPAAGGTGFDWSYNANWDPGIVPSREGMIALMNNDLTGDQTVNVNTPITLGELSVGDSSGSQTTLLRKNTDGSFLFDQTDAGMAYLTRTAGGTGDVTFKDDLNITLNDNLTVRLAGGSASSTMTIAGSVSGSGKGLTKEGDSLSLILSGANTYTGATTISANSGTLEIGGAGKLGNGSYAGAIDIGSGSTLKYSSSAAQTLGGTISGAGAIIKSTGTNMLTLSGSNTGFLGSVTILAGKLGLGHVNALSGAGAITLAGGTSLIPNVQNAVINATVTLSGGGTTTINAPTVAGGGGSTPVPFTLNGPIGGTGSVTFRGTQNTNAYGTIILNAACDYSGGTLMNCSGSSNTEIFVHLGIANALPVTTVLTMDGGEGTGSGRYTTLDLKGFNQTLAGLTNIARSLRSQRVVNTSATAATLTLNNTTDCTFSGSLGTNSGNANFGLTKTGPGRFTLSGANAYTGATIISAGSLALGANNVLADTTAIAIANATLDAATHADTAGTLEVAGNATIHLDAGATLAFADSNAIDWSSGTLNVTGTFAAGSSLRFGTTSGGLTSSQLALIAIDGAAVPLALDANGYLVQAAGGYAAWKAANAPNTGSDPNADEDGDGVSNGIEYLLGGTSAADDIGKLPEIATAGGNMVVSFVRDQASIDGSTTVEIEVGDNLATWPTRYPVPGTAVANNPGVTVGKGVPVAGKDTITLTLPQAPDTANFIRLKVTMP